MKYDTLLAGAYQVEKTLERSTYSVLCVGKSSTTQEPVRLRLWPTAHASTPEDQQRIEAEVAAIQAVQHPHLLPVLAVHASKQGVFLVSAPVQDGSLNTRLSQQILKPLPFDEALRISTQAGQALQALHEHGITHGNLTPLTVFFTQPEHACLGECSLQSIQACISGYQPLLDENIPRCWYMAPEQFEGQFSTHTDQYALGCLTYVLLTGHVPFAGSARAALQQKHQQEQPRPLRTLNAEVPAHVEAAVLQALAKIPTERHRSVLSFLQALGTPPANTNVFAQTEQDKETGTAASGQEQKSSAEEVESVEKTVGAVVAGTEVVTHASENGRAHEENTRPDTLIGTTAHVGEAQTTWADLATMKQPALGVVASEQANGGATIEKRLIPSAGSGNAKTLSPIAPGASRVPKPPAGQVSRTKSLAVLAPMVALILVIVLVLGSWFALAGSHTVLSQLATPGSTQKASSTTITTGNLQPSPTGTVNVIGVRYPTPTPVRQPTAAPTPTTPVGTPPGAATVIPFGCLTQDNNGDLVAEFGYTNPGGSTVTIPIGTNNHLSPIFNGFQPTSFGPGTVSNAFMIPLFGMTSESWTLNGRTSKVTRHGPFC